MILLLFQQRGVSFRNQALSLSAVTPGGSSGRCNPSPWPKGRQWESLDLAAVTSTWMDSSSPMVGMVAQEGISAGSLEEGTDEVDKAHGTSVCTLLKVDGRAP